MLGGGGRASWKRKRAWVKEPVASLAQRGRGLAAAGHKRLWEGQYHAQAKRRAKQLRRRCRAPGRQLLEARCPGEEVVMGRLDLRD